MYKKNYKEKFVIGRGNFGVATLITEKSSNQDFVAKKITLSNLSSYELKSCQLESKLLESLDHPNIVKYKESILESDQMIIIMEYCEGGDLSHLIKAHKEERSFFPEEQINQWMVQMLSALKYLEEKKIIHRDIKSSNVYLTRCGDLKLGDFGIAKMLSYTNEVAKTVVGTPYYMSPEVCENKPYTCKSDIWSLGCLVYELASLNYPFSGSSFLGLVMNILKEKPPEMPGIYSREFTKIVNKMLVKNPAERPPASALLKEVEFSENPEEDYDYDISEDSSDDNVILCSNSDNFGLSLINPLELVNSNFEASGDADENSGIPTFTPDDEIIEGTVFRISRCFEEDKAKAEEEHEEYEDDFESVMFRKESSDMPYDEDFEEDEENLKKKLINELGIETFQKTWDFLKKNKELKEENEDGLK